MCLHRASGLSAHRMHIIYLDDMTQVWLEAVFSGGAELYLIPTHFSYWTRLHSSAAISPSGAAQHDDKFHCIA